MFAHLRVVWDMSIDCADGKAYGYALLLVSNKPACWDQSICRHQVKCLVNFLIGNFIFIHIQRFPHRCEDFREVLS